MTYYNKKITELSFFMQYLGYLIPQWIFCHVFFHLGVAKYKRLEQFSLAQSFHGSFNSRMYILMHFILSRNKCINTQMPWPPNSQYCFCQYKQLQSLADIFVPVYCCYNNYCHWCHKRIDVIEISILLHYSCRILQTYLFLSPLCDCQEC